jgi:hypothetical protein
MKLRKPASRVFASAVAILVLGGAQAAMAQGMPPMPCEQWTTPVGLPPGATIGFIDVKRVGEKLQGYAYLGDRIVPGTFVRTGANPNMVVAIWDIPLAGAKGYLTFTAAREADLLFQSADPRDPTAPIRVKTGFTQFKRGPYRQLCGTSNTGKFVSAGAEAEPGLHDDDEAGDPAAGRGWSARTEELDESEPKRLVPRVIRPAPAKPVPSLESLLPKAGAKAIPEKAPPKTPIAELMPATKPPVAAAKPAVVDADRGMRVCRH